MTSEQILKRYDLDKTCWNEEPMTPPSIKDGCVCGACIYWGNFEEGPGASLHWWEYPDGEVRLESETTGMELIDREWSWETYRLGDQFAYHVRERWTNPFKMLKEC